MDGRFENIDIDLIARYLSGELSTAEEQEFQRWLAGDPGRRRLLEEFSSVWEKLGRVESVAGIDLDEEWLRVLGRT